MREISVSDLKNRLGIEAEPSLRVARLATVLGLLLVIAAVIVASQRLDTKDPPFERAPGIAFLGPATDVMRKGIVVSVATEVTTCDAPIDVTVTATGTAEYWRRNRAHIPRRAPFAFSVRDADISNIQVASGLFQEGLDPTIPSLPRSVVRGGERLRATVRRKDDTTKIAGHISGWRDNWHPIELRFTADWLARRDARSCYLRLPALVGLTVADFGYGDARSRATLLAHNNLTFFGGTIDASSSRPPPDLWSSVSAVWQCEDPFPALGASRQPLNPRDFLGRSRLGGGLIVLGPKGLAYSERAYRRGTFRASGCDALATMQQRGAGVRRDLEVLVLGAVLALGLALIVEGQITKLGSKWKARAARSA